MNENLKKLEKKMFIEMYGEEEFENLKSLPKVKIPEEYSERPPSIRAEIDKRNNLNQREMKKFEDLFNEFNPENSEHDFRKIASNLMSNFVIRINTHEYLFTEIEFYCQTIDKNRHHDPYVHGDDLQKRMSHWYFHGSGLDLTFGNELYYGGILIRGIKTKSDGEFKYISGPLNVVKELFSKANKVDEENIFCLAYKNNASILIDEPFFVRRVGLNEKHNEEFYNKKYRAIVDISSKHPFKEKEKVYKTLKEDSSVNVNLEKLFGYKIK
ncbi:MAG: hypothetical protein HS119_13465 [Flavobacteriales bacterium]|nr:hypothetical protein [Flavobacteriales bacterium]